MKKIKEVIFVASFISLTAFASVQTLEPKGGQVTILAKGKPSFIKIEGTGNPATGKISVDGRKIDGEFDFNLASLDTKIETRNEHMKKKYLEVEKYPKATLQITSVQTNDTWSLERPKLTEAPFEGMLTLHGETKPVKGVLTISNARSVEAKFTVKISDFKVAVPTFAGVTVADDVDVDVQIDKLE